VGCGRVAPKSQLVRVALARDAGGGGARAVLDHAGKMPGRGAYLCREAPFAEPAVRCLAQAARNRGIPRTLRAGARIDSELLESMAQ
jgi:predicted RNA-binding protein YlxR (DUF448 family)